MFILLKLFLFFSWFISFSVMNFGEWGLQLSWLIAIILIPLTFANLLTGGRLAFTGNSILSVYVIFAFIFVFKCASYFYTELKFISLPNWIDPSRTFYHTTYILFYFLLFISLHRLFNVYRKRRKIIFLWLFIYPFMFIAIWGIYQWVSTFGLIPYSWIFNNNPSTGFTYYRFMHDHRTASVFPEPSEYSYYLCLMGPLLWANYRKKLSEHTNNRVAKLSLLLWLTQAYMVNSLTFTLGMIFVLFLSLRYIENQPLWKIFGFSSVLVLVFVLLTPDVLQRVIASLNGADSSTLSRYAVAVQTIKLAEISPHVGLGYGVVRGIDAVTFFIASFGYTGAMLFSLILLYNIIALKSKNNVYFVSLLTFTIAYLVSNNVLGHIFFWTILAYFTSQKREYDHNLNTAIKH